ncbi:MAG: hypothetical protein JXL67_11855 [Calditrichaeota bacterium]|nr:hypothetical protein [Calditrichota bacterium]
MKKITFFAVIIFLTGVTSGQKIESGNLLGIHIVDELDLKPGVTMEDFEDFFLNRYIPAFQKNFTEIKIIPMKGIRGEHENKMGLIMYMKSDKTRDVYWNEDGSYNEKSQAILEKLQPLLDEANSMAVSADLYTDWLVVTGKPSKSAKTVEAEYPNLYSTSNFFIKNNLDHGAKIILSDDSIWEIAPKDRSIAVSDFIIGTRVRVRRFSASGGYYSYRLTVLLEQGAGFQTKSIEAKFLGF